MGDSNAWKILLVSGALKGAENICAHILAWGIVVLMVGILSGYLHCGFLLLFCILCLF